MLEVYTTLKPDLPKGYDDQNIEKVAQFFKEKTGNENIIVREIFPYDFEKEDWYPYSLFEYSTGAHTFYRPPLEHKALLIYGIETNNYLKEVEFWHTETKLQARYPIYGNNETFFRNPFMWFIDTPLDIAFKVEVVPAKVQILGYVAEQMALNTMG